MLHFLNFPKINLLLTLKMSRVVLKHTNYFENV